MSSGAKCRRNLGVDERWPGSRLSLRVREPDARHPWLKRGAIAQTHAVMQLLIENLGPIPVRTAKFVAEGTRYVDRGRQFLYAARDLRWISGIRFHSIVRRAVKRNGNHDRQYQHAPSI